MKNFKSHVNCNLTDMYEKYPNCQEITDFEYGWVQIGTPEHFHDGNFYDVIILAILIHRTLRTLIFTQTNLQINLHVQSLIAPFLINCLHYLLCIVICIKRQWTLA